MFLTHLFLKLTNFSIAFDVNGGIRMKTYLFKSTFIIIYYNQFLYLIFYIWYFVVFNNTTRMTVETFIKIFEDFSELKIIRKVFYQDRNFIIKRSNIWKFVHPELVIDNAYRITNLVAHNFFSPRFMWWHK